jgi:hypothetical protein
MKQEYSGWSGVRTLAKKLGYSWFDVCDILWKTKHHKQPKFKEILIFSIIRKNLIRIKSGKPFVYWCNPFEPINKGKLGTTQSWRKEERIKQYY